MKKKKYRELKESFRMMKSHKVMLKKLVSLRKAKKKIGINEVIKRNDIINNSLK